VVVVPAAGELAQVVVGEVLHDPGAAAVAAEEVLPDERAVGRRVRLNWPSGVVFILFTSTPSMSLASSGSQSRPHTT